MTEDKKTTKPVKKNMNASKVDKVKSNNMKQQTKSNKIKKSMFESNCNDKNCPKCGTISLRGRTFVGVVVSDKMNKTAIVEWERIHFLPKYERYTKRKTRIKVHNPTCINAKKGDKVKIMESRPLSKTKNFVIIDIIKD